MENVTEWLDEDYVTTSYWLHDNRTAATRLSYPVVDDPLASTTVTTTASAAAAAATEDYLPDWIDLFLAVCFSTLIVITIVGNTLVIAAVITTRRLRSVTNCFVSSLAAADLLVGLAVMPPAVMLQLNGGTWELGEVLCDSWVSLDVLLCTASILSLCAISIDRYLAVTQPLIYSRRRRSKRLAGLMIVVVWIMAGAITSPPLLGCFPRARNSLELDKKCSYNMDSSYVVFSAVGSFFLPLMVMLYVYGRISCVIAKRHRSLETTDHAVSTGDCHKNSKHNREDLPRMHRRSVRRTSHAAQPSESRAAKSSAKLTTPRSILSSRLSTASVSEGTASDVGPNNNKSPVLTCTSLSTTATTTLTTTTTTTTLMVPEPTVGEATSSSPSRKLTRIGTMRVGHQHSCINRVTRETKTAGTLAVVVGGFVACWLPFFILYLATPFMPVEPPDPLMPALTWLGWLNSAMNPFIYAFYSADFRTAFWRLTCRKCSRSRLDTNPAYYQGAASAALPSWRRQTSRT